MIVKCKSSLMLQMRNTEATSWLSYQRATVQYKGRHCEACSFQFLWNVCILFWASSRKSHARKSKKKATTIYCVPISISSSVSRSARAQTILDGSREDEWLKAYKNCNSLCIFSFKNKMLNILLFFFPHLKDLLKEWDNKVSVLMVFLNPANLTHYHKLLGNKGHFQVSAYLSISTEIC